MVIFDRSFIGRNLKNGKTVLVSVDILATVKHGMGSLACTPFHYYVVVKNLSHFPKVLMV